MSRFLLSAFVTLLAIIATGFRCTGDRDVARGGMETTGGVFATLEYPDLVLEGPSGMQVGIYDTAFLAQSSELFSATVVLDADGKGRVERLDERSFSLYGIHPESEQIAYLRNLPIHPDSSYRRQAPLTEPVTIRRAIILTDESPFDTVAGFIPGTPLIGLRDADGFVTLRQVPTGTVPFAVAGMKQKAGSNFATIADEIYREEISIDSGTWVEDTLTIPTQ